MHPSGAAWPPTPGGGGPAAGKVLLGVTVGDHFRRLRNWRIARITPSDAESARLTAAGLSDPTSRSFAVWRRSSLMLASPVVLFTAALAVIGFKDVETSEEFNDLGILAQVLPLLGPIALATGVLVALRSWTDLRASSRALTLAWVGSVVLPLLPALLPLDWLLNRDVLIAEAGGDVASLDALLSIAKVGFGLAYAVQLMPALVTFPGGVLNGCVRVKGLLPDATLPGYFLVTTAPFYSLIVLVALVLIIQFAGTGLLVIGALLLAVSPWTYVARRRHYLGNELAAGDDAGLDRSQSLNSMFTLAGIGAIVLWALTAKVGGVKVVDFGDKGMLSALEVGRSGIEVLARGLLTTVVFASMFANLTLSSWRTARAQRDDPRVVARNEALLAAISEPEQPAVPTSA